MTQLNESNQLRKWKLWSSTQLPGSNWLFHQWKQSPWFFTSGSSHHGFPPVEAVIVVFHRGDVMANTVVWVQPPCVTWFLFPKQESSQVTPASWNGHQRVVWGWEDDEDRNWSPHLMLWSRIGGSKPRGSSCCSFTKGNKLWYIKTATGSTWFGMCC